MGNRLTRIYTRTGDDGSTGLGDGTRVAKDALRIQTYGTVDELNSQLGVLLALDCPEDIAACLREIQHALFDLGSELCIPGYRVIVPEATEWLEAWLDHWNAELPPLKDFILPGGSPTAAACHVARTLCRRTERLMVSLMAVEDINLDAIAYINRLSDFLFVAARVLARQSGTEVLWAKERQPPWPR
jgi:cob(I)alamin adenosyltransferase